MIVETIVHILMETPEVAAIVGARVFPDVIPEASDYPCVVVQKAYAMGEYTNDGDAGIEDARVQVDCYSADGATAVVALKKAVRGKLSGFKGGRASGSPCAIDACFCINDVPMPVPEAIRAGPRLRRRMLEFRVWNREL